MATFERDIRSASKPFKRDKDHGAKWANGQRPSYGCYYQWTEEGTVLKGGSEAQRAKVRPQKHWTEHKGHIGNRAPKLNGANTYDLGRVSGRVARGTDAYHESNDKSLSDSLLEDLPKQVVNAHAAIKVSDANVLYSFDNSGPSPTPFGRNLGLEGLVDQAEKKWVSDQTEKIVRGEYEVLDGEGETTVLKKGKRSPKQKALKTQPAVVKNVEEEDDGFELI